MVCRYVFVQSVVLSGNLLLVEVNSLELWNSDVHHTSPPCINISVLQLISHKRRRYVVNCSYRPSTCVLIRVLHLSLPLQPVTTMVRSTLRGTRSQLEMVATTGEIVWCVVW